MKFRTEFIYDDEEETVEIVKQEVIDEDKDWSLAEQKEADELTYTTSKMTPVKYWGSDVKKCRDLITADINKHSGWLKPFHDIINKRFGDL